MTLQIELTPEIERRLATEAEHRGIDESSVVSHLIEEYVPPVPGAATLALFDQWARQDATDDPDLICSATEDLSKLKQALNANRSSNGERILFP